jgi:hypothetical protein
VLVEEILVILLECNMVYQQPKLKIAVNQNTNQLEDHEKDGMTVSKTHAPNRTWESEMQLYGRMKENSPWHLTAQVDDERMKKYCCASWFV